MGLTSVLYNIHHKDKFFFPMPPHVLSDFVVSHPLLWLKYNRLLKLGRPVGAVTLSLWEWRWSERWIWGARGALNLISTNCPDHGHHGRLPLSRKNAHGRAVNRTRDLMFSSQELWPPSHEDGQYVKCIPLQFEGLMGIGRAEADNVEHKS